jgi:hypothetical protein
MMVSETGSTKGVPVETTAFRGYLDEHGGTAALAESLRDLMAQRRERNQRRARARRGALLPIPIPADPPYRRRAAS